MVLTYRTTDTTKWGAGKGAKLTSGEIDNNFWDLISRILTLEGNPVQPNQISNITLTGSQLTISLSDGTQFGPYTIPVATMHFRGDWTANTQYYQLDLIRVIGKGLYLVMRDHISATTFDPNATTVDGVLYSLILPGTSSFLEQSDTPAAWGVAGQIPAINGTADGLIWIDPPAGTTTFLGLTDTPGIWGTAGQIPTINSTANGLVFSDPPSGGGATTFLGLTDTPAAFGTAGQLVSVNGTADGLIFSDAPSGSGIADAPSDSKHYVRINAAWAILPFDDWANITGKPLTFPPSAHTHPWGDVTGKPATIDALPATIGAVGTVLKAGAGGTIVWGTDEGATSSVVSYVGNRTLALSDVDQYLQCTDTVNTTLTVPANATVAFPIDTIIHHRTAGAGKVTVTAATGVVLNPPFGQTLVTPGDGATISLKKVAADEWDVIGHTEPTSAGMLKSVYDTNDNGIVDRAATADSVPWANLTGHVSVIAGDGIAGGGILSTDKTLAVDTSVLRTNKPSQVAAEVLRYYDAHNLGAGTATVPIDLNTLILGGTYTGNNLTNAPSGAGTEWLYIEVLPYVDNKYILQIATWMTNTTANRRWMRKQVNGVWYPWVQIWSDNSIDRGNNANGDYVRYPDGTQICWYSYSAGTIATTNENSGLYRSDTFTLSYPVGFSVTPAASIGMTTPFANGWLVEVGAAGTSSWSVTFARLIATAAAGVATSTVHLIAIGKWKQMQIIFSPQRNDIHLNYAFNGEIITVSVDGVETEIFDFTGTPDGEINEIDQGALPISAVLSASRVNGNLTVTLVITHNNVEQASQETRFPNNPYTEAAAIALLDARDIELEEQNAGP